MGIVDDYVAYCFDSAVSLFGSFVEGKLRETTKWGHPRYHLEGLLSGDTDEGVFASSMELIASAERQ